MIPPRTKQILAALLLAAVLLLPQGTLSAPSRTEVYGIVMTDDAKQLYMREKMQAFYRGTAEAAPLTLPAGWTAEHEALGGVPVDRYTPTHAAHPRVLLQLHGGGYIMRLGDVHRALALRLGVLMNASMVYCVDYRIAPAHLYPAALEDAVRVYRTLLARGTRAEDIVLVGDSAGGNLALALVLDLREHDLPQPGVIALASPWATMEHRAGTSRTTNADADCVLGRGTPLYPLLQTGDYSGGAFARSDPRLSPLYADLRGLPPLLIQTGGSEVFRTEDEELAARAAACGVPVTLTVYPGMPHDFALIFPELADSSASLQEIADFVEKYMKEERPRSLLRGEGDAMPESDEPHE